MGSYARSSSYFHMTQMSCNDGLGAPPPANPTDAVGALVGRSVAVVVATDCRIGPAAVPPAVASAAVTRCAPCHAVLLSAPHLVDRSHPPSRAHELVLDGSLDMYLTPSVWQ